MRALTSLISLLLLAAPLPAALFTSASAGGNFNGNPAFGATETNTGTSSATASKHGVAANYSLAPGSFTSNAVATATHGALTGRVTTAITSGSFGEASLGGAIASASGSTAAQFTDFVRFVPVTGISNGSTSVLRLYFTMSGSGSAPTFAGTITAPGGTLGVSAAAALNASVNGSCSVGADFRDGASRTCEVVLVSTTGAGVFRNGVNIDATFQVSAGITAGATPLLPYLEGTVIADGSHTATFSGFDYFIDGNQLLPSQFSVIASSGAIYPYAAPSPDVPEPATWALLAAGLLALRFRR